MNTKQTLNDLYRYTKELRDRLPTYDEAKNLVYSRSQELGIGGHYKILKTFESAWESPRRTFHLTELGNGERFVCRFGEDIRFCPEQKNWYIWDGKKWIEDNADRILELAEDTVNSILTESKALPDGNRYKTALYSHWKKSHKVSQLNNLVKAASIDKKIKISQADLDKNKWLLNCQNGTLDLKTGVLMQHKREEFITKITPIECNPDAECRIWKKFLHRATGGDQELISFLQRVVGYALTGETDEKCLFFLFGGTDTGKTTFLEAIRELMGEYARGTDFQTFIYKKYSSTIRNDIARLEGARFVSASEAGRDQKFDEPLIKQITGRDKVIARFLYQEFNEFTPEFKIFLAANHRPKITGVDDAIWNRIIVVPFNVRIPEDEQDKNLYKKLRDELPGILIWAAEGCLDWQEHGLQPPLKVKKALRMYRVEADVVEQFINDRCHQSIKGSSTFTDLYYEWKDWCSINQVDPGSGKNFAQILDSKGYQSDRKWVDGKQHRIRKGIELML